MGAGAADTGGAPGVVGAVAGCPPPPLNKVNKVLAATVFASPVELVTIFFEEVLTV